MTKKLSFFSLRTGFLTGPQAYAVTLAATGFAALVTVVAAPVLVSTPFMVFTAAVIVSTWFGGYRQGFLSALVGAGFANYFLLPPREHWSFGPTELLRTVLWMAFVGGLAVLLSQVRKSEDRARKILASIAEGFLIIDRDWTLIYANEVGAQIIGKSKREIMGRTFWELFIGRPTEQQLRRCAAERVPVQFETHCQRRQKWIQLHAYPFPEGMSIFIQDITATKLKEEGLRSSLERLATAHKAAQMGIFEWNVKTNEILWSEDTYRIHGLTRDQFDGKFETWAKSIHPEDLPALLAKIKKAVETKSEFLAEYREVWHNGEVHWFGAHGQVVVDEGGDATGMVGTCSDITHRHLEEEVLRRSEKLAAAGRLAATIAHEINNPLEAVTNLLYLIRQDVSLGRETRALLRASDEQLSRVNHIARQTLGFYRDPNTPETVDVAQVMEELLTIFQTRLTARQICVVREYANVGAITAFKGELRQVLSNLITNAIDASSFGSKLILRVRPEVSVGTNAIPLVRIEVEDFGSGIGPWEMTRIFEPFFTTKSDVGTGLGLWVSKEIVEKNGGHIAFRTKCDDGNSGTCFTVVMPVTTVAA